MPKVIEGLEDRILQAARKRLLGEDVSSFSLRGVAGDCGIAVGTIYNYFRNKETLMAAVMVQDWMDALERTKKELEQADSLEEGLLHICRAIRNYCVIYQEVWSSYPAGGEFSTRYRKRHEMLLSQITGTMKRLFARLEVPCSETGLTLYAELIIAGAQHPEIREEEIIEIIGKAIV